MAAPRFRIRFFKEHVNYNPTMERRRLGRTDIWTSVLGFGGGEIGHEQASLRTVERILGPALDRGLSLIDTAECYLASEELIGAAVGHRRDDYYLMSKCGHAADFALPDWDPRLIGLSVERSLKRLRTDHLDVVHLHSCGSETLRRGDVIEALQRVRDSGKTRYIGYSGDGIAALDAIECGAFDTLQVSVNIADQEAIERVLPIAAEAGIGVVAKRSIANAVWRSTERVPYLESYRDRLHKLNYGLLQSPSRDGIERALRFTLSTQVQTALVGTTSPQHLLEDMELAAGGPLTMLKFDSIRARWKIAAQPDWIGLQ